MIKPSSCSPCSLYKISNGFLESEGMGTSGVIILGESGGYEEFIDGLPFRPKAASGSTLDRAIKIVSKDLSIPLTRQSFLLYNVVNCNPPNNQLEGKPYEENAIANCSKNVAAKIRGLKVSEGKRKVVIALGNIALRAMTPFSGSSAIKESIKHLRGYVYYNGIYNCYVVPSLHPSFVRRGNLEFMPILISDIKKALRVANGTLNNFPSHSSYSKPNYIEHSSIEDIESLYFRLIENSKLDLKYDIETPFSVDLEEDERDDLEKLARLGGKEALEEREITQIQFSTEIGKAYCVKFNTTFFPLIKKIMERTNNPKTGFNCWNFDNPRLEGKGIRINGRNDDLMWMFKHYSPRLPRNLQSVASLFDFPFPWKHLFGSKLEWYGCTDVDCLNYIKTRLVKEMKGIGTV